MKTTCWIFAASLILSSGCHSSGDAVAERPDQSKKERFYSDAELQQMVERLYVKEDPRRANFFALRSAGTRAVPFLIRALNDPRTRTATFADLKFDLSGTSPFVRIGQLLAETAPPGAVKPLTTYIDHPNTDFRAEAGYVLGRIGTADCLEPVRKALADREHHVREMTLIGVGNALKEERRDQAFLSGMQEVLVPMLKDAGYDIEGPATVLVEIDAVKAMPILESPEYFSLGNPQLDTILKALNREGHKTPHAILLPLMKELEPLAAKDTRRSVEYEHALFLYGRNPDAAADAKLHALLGSDDESVAYGAAMGLEILAGIEPSDVVFALYDASKFTAMTQPQQYYYAAREYQDEVLNGGHDQYFSNSSGDTYRTAIEALRAMGATAKLSILMDATTAFSPEKPSVDQQARRVQLDHMSAIGDGVLKAADRRYYDSEKKAAERMETLMTLYALEHRADFLPVAAAGVKPANQAHTTRPK